MEEPRAINKPLIESCTHHNSDAHDHNLKKLYISSLICFVFMIAEIVGGLLANSIGIMSDAAHMLSDLSAFGVAIFSICLVKRPASTNMTYGYHRAEIIGAVISVACIWVLTVWLVYEAVLRILDPQPINGLIMLITAVVGLACNIGMGLTLSHHGHNHSHEHDQQITHNEEEGEMYDMNKHQENVNVRAAWLHVIGDLLQSVGVTVAGVLVFYNEEWVIADPLCTLLFSIIVLFTTIPIMKECVGVLMEGVPIGIDIEDLSCQLKCV